MKATAIEIRDGKQSVVLGTEGKDEWVYAIWPPEDSAVHSCLGRFGVAHTEFGKAKEKGMLEGIVWEDKDTVAVVKPYAPSNGFSPKEAKITDSKSILDYLIFDLALRGARVVVIANDDSPDYSKAAPQLGFSQLESGLRYVKPSLEVNVSHVSLEYMPIPNPKSIFGRYTLDVSLKPNWNSAERKVGTQHIDIVPVRTMYDWCKKAMHRQGLNNDSLVASFGSTANLHLDWGVAVPRFFTSSTIKTAKQYFGKITKLVEQQRHVEGIAITVSYGGFQEYWSHLALSAVTSLGYRQIRQVSEIYFKKLSAYSTQSVPAK